MLVHLHTANFSTPSGIHLCLGNHSWNFAQLFRLPSICPGISIMTSTTSYECPSRDRSLSSILQHRSSTVACALSLCSHTNGLPPSRQVVSIHRDVTKTRLTRLMGSGFFSPRLVSGELQDTRRYHKKSSMMIYDYGCN